MSFAGISLFEDLCIPFLWASPLTSKDTFLAFFYLVVGNNSHHMSWCR